MSDMGNFYGTGPLMKRGISFVTQDSAAEMPELGCRVLYKGEEYVWFHNVTASTEIQPNKLVTNSLLSGYSLTVSTVSGGIALAATKHVTIPSGGYGWGLVRGLNQMTCTSTLVSGVMIAVGDDGAVRTGVSGSFPTGMIIGQTLSSATSNGEALCILRLMG